MAAWTTVTFKFDLFDPLRPPLEALLALLELIQAILEALLALLKPFFLDLLNPLDAIVAALLAALNAIINQIESTGLNLLLVHPDTSQPDLAAIFESVSGGYSSFESKVVQKFYDQADIFRPQYAPGSSIAMLILYTGVTSPGDLMKFIQSLLALFNLDVDTSLPAPVDVKVTPVKQGNQAITQFRALFDDSLEEALTIEWRMPQAPAGTDVAGMVNQAVSLYNNIRLPNFIIERTGPFPVVGKQLNPQGEAALIVADSATLGTKVNNATERYNFPPVRSKIAVKEPDGTAFKVFPTKYDVGGANLAEGLLTGSYKYTDTDNISAGNTYYYRIRAYFGDATEYLAVTDPDSITARSPFVDKKGNEGIADFRPALALGRASRVVPGFVPRKISSESYFDPYLDILDAVRVGLLLNFELPRTYPENSGIEDTDTRLGQKTGWGTLAGMGGAIAPLKLMFSSSNYLQDNVLFNAKARRLVNSALSSIQNNPQISSILEEKWKEGVQTTVGRFYIRDSGTLSNDPVETNVIENEEGEVEYRPALNKIWRFPAIVGGMTKNNAATIDNYLAKEDSYQVGMFEFDGPVPISDDYGNPYATVQERLDLANFIQVAVGAVGASTSYLAWQSLTVGDLFPELTPFLFDFQQFLLALLKAVESFLKAITDIIQTLIQRIVALKQIVQSILDLIELLSISISASVLSYSGFGSPDDLVLALVESEDKPEDSPYGLHSGIVMCAGGPGPGFIAAIEAILFIFSMGGAGG